MKRSGQIFAKNDELIEELLSNQNFQINEDGSIDTLIARTGKKTDKWRKTGINPNSDGYCELHYKRKRLSVHRIIYRKFIGKLEPDLVINHIDGIKSNNRPVNLELITQAENNAHRFRIRRKKTDSSIVNNKTYTRF